MSRNEDNSLFGALTEFADLYGTDGNSFKGNIVDIDINLIASFKDHPFKVEDNEQMQELVESIREFGVLTPVLVRKAEYGTYEMISGHRRLFASERAGLAKIPAKVVEVEDDLAQIMLVDANIQREEILPSERAYAYRMRVEALKKYRKRNNIFMNEADFTPVIQTQMEEATGVRYRTITKYIRLTKLVPKLLDYVDTKVLSVLVGAELSYYSEEIQDWIADYIDEGGMIKNDSLVRLKKIEDFSMLTKETLFDILDNLYVEPGTFDEYDDLDEEEESEGTVEEAFSEGEERVFENAADTADNVSGERMPPEIADDGPSVPLYPSDSLNTESARVAGKSVLSFDSKKLNTYCPPTKYKMEDIEKLVMDFLEIWYKAKQTGKPGELMAFLVSIMDY